MTQAPLAFADDAETRPVISRILAVEAWRAEYLQMLQQIAEVELNWRNLKPRIDAYRKLIEVDVVRDPFHGDRTRFRDALYADENSIRSFAEQRRRFLLEHPSISPDSETSKEKGSESTDERPSGNRSPSR